jgi:hypothetical protein
MNSTKRREEEEDTPLRVDPIMRDIEVPFPFWKMLHNLVALSAMVELRSKGIEENNLEESHPLYEYFDSVYKFYGSSKNEN